MTRFALDLVEIFTTPPPLRQAEKRLQQQREVHNPLSLSYILSTDESQQDDIQFLWFGQNPHEIASSPPG